MDIPDSLLQLLLRRLPSLPQDQDPKAAWSETFLRRALSSVVTETTRTGVVPAALGPALTTYLAQASDGQLRWLVTQLHEVTAHLEAADAQDRAQDPAQLTLA